MNNTANDLQKGFNELQIDADLANDTDLTAPLTFDTPVSNRTQNDNVDHANATGSTATPPFETPVNNRTTQNDDHVISNEWKTFYKDVDKSPPKAVRDVHFSAAVEQANKLLRHSRYPEFEKLDNIQKAIMMLMITKKMHRCFVGFTLEEHAEILVRALDPDRPEHMLIKGFVRRGGDYDADSDLTDKALTRFDAIRTEFENLGITIFTGRDDMKPFLYFQRENSFICTFTACSTLLYYRTYDITRQPVLKTNISRYIRDEIDGAKIANLTFTKQKGSYLRDILDCLMESFGDDGRACDTFRLWKKNIDLNYRNLRELLKDGRPFALTMEVFPGFNHWKTMRFAGKISDYYQNTSERRPTNPKDRSYHAVVCIGIKPRDGITPPMLLLQDSQPRRPAFSIGLDLLMDMGRETSLLCVIPEDWRPKPDMGYEVTDKARASFAGHPMAIDKNANPYMVTSENPVQAKPRDMSRYCQWVDASQPHASWAE